MPYRDPEERKRWNKEQMRRRRADKAREDNMPQTDSQAGAISPADVGYSEGVRSFSNSEVATSPAVEPIRTNVPIHPDQPTLLPDTEEPENYHLNRLNRWLVYPKGQGFLEPYDDQKDPNQFGFPCCKAPGRCCLPLRHEPPRKAVTQCLFPVPQCIYYKDPNNQVISFGNLVETIDFGYQARMEV